MLALVAGTGGLPRVLAERAMAAGDPPVICVLRGFEPSVPEDLPRLDFRLETFGTLLTTLKEAGVDRLCMAGAVRRTEIDESLIDERTWPLVPRLAEALARGDDGTLRAIIGIIEEQGIAVIAVDEIAPDLLPRSGVPTKTAPPAHASADALAAEAALAVMARADLGQAVVVRDGKVLAQEDSRGTAALIADFCLPLGEEQPEEWSLSNLPGLLGIPTGWGKLLSVGAGTPTPLPGAGAILFKAPKPGQERRADLPLIGPETAMAGAEAGFAGIVIEAGGVLVLDEDLVVSICDQTGMFLWVRPERGGA